MINFGEIYIQNCSYEKIYLINFRKLGLEKEVHDVIKPKKHNSQYKYYLSGAFKLAWITFLKNYTAWKVSVFGVFLGRIFPHSDWVRRDTLYIHPYSVRIQKNTDHKNSQYGHFSRSVKDKTKKNFIQKWRHKLTHDGYLTNMFLQKMWKFLEQKMKKFDNFKVT